MAIVKNKIKDNFTIIPNEIIYNEKISNNAFRLLVYLWSKPSDWKVNQKNVAKDFDVHINSIKKWIKELKECGYLNILKRNVGQSFEYVYELIYEVHYSVPRDNDEVHFDEGHLTKHTVTDDRESVLHNKTEFTNTEFTNTNIKEKINKKESFKKPSLEELESYCVEKNIKNVDIEVFINFYESNGWMVGKNKMKNWKATISNWNKRNFNNSSNKKEIGNTKGWYQEEKDGELSKEEIDEMNKIIEMM